LLTTFLSNMILGMGIWTIWQVIAWALIGFLSGMIGKYSTKLPLYIIVSFSFMSGYIYGLIISLTTYQVTENFFPIMSQDYRLIRIMQWGMPFLWYCFIHLSVIYCENMQKIAFQLNIPADFSSWYVLPVSDTLNNIL